MEAMHAEDIEGRFAEAFIPRKEVEDAGRAARQRIMTEVRELGLVERAWELEVDGYTVLGPDQLGSSEITPRLLEASLALAERSFGHRPDLHREADRPELVSPFGNVETNIGILGEGRVFEEALLNRPVLALVSYLLGESCTLVHQSLYIKSPGPDHLPLHTDQDQTGSPSPFTHFAQVANATWALTDYTVENGAICFVPGSHRLCRAPTRHEATDLSIFQPVEAEAGSVIIWHGNTWHGALRRTAPGVRVSIVEYFGRWFLAGANTSTITAEMLERNPPRFAQLVRSHASFDELGSVRLQAAKETLYG
jgi:hypothetical protein